MCARNVCNVKCWVPNTRIRGHIRWFRDPAQEYQPDGYKGQLPETLKADMLTCSMVQKNLIYGGVGGGHKNGNYFLLDISYP